MTAGNNQTIASIEILKACKAPKLH